MTGTAGAGRTVLVGFAEALAAPECVWSLQDAGFAVEAFTRQGSVPAIRRLRSVTLHPIRPPEVDAAGAVADLNALVSRLRPDLLMPLDDAAVWLADRAELAGTLLAGPAGLGAALALDKQRQLEAALAAGFRVPRTVVCSVPGDAREWDEFPCVAKPALAVGLEGGRLLRGPARVCTDRGQLERTVAALSPTGPVLVQELVQGTGEGVFGLAQSGTVAAWSGHRRLRMMNPSGSGSSACLGAIPDPGDRLLAERLIAEARWTGLFMVELLRDAAGEAWFVELNGRPWGSMALARRSRFEYPAWAALDVLGIERSSEIPTPLPGLRCRHLGRELVHLLFVLRGAPPGEPKWPTRRRAMREVLTLRRGDRWYNLRRGHLGLFADDALRTVVGAVRRSA